MLGLKKKKYTCTFFRQLLWWWFWSQAIVSPALQPPWPGPDAPPKADPARSFHAATAPASAASPAQAAPFPFWRAECPRLAELTPCWHRPRSLHGTFIFRSLTAIKTYLDYFQSDSPLNRCSGGQALSPPKVKEGKTKRNEKNWTRTKALQTSLQPHQRCAQSGVRGPQPQHGHRGSRGDSRCSAPCSQHPHHGPHLSCQRLPTAPLPRTHSRRRSSCPAWWPGHRMARGRCHRLSPHTAPAAGGCCRSWLPPAHRSSSNGSVFNSNGFVF